MYSCFLFLFQALGKTHHQKPLVSRNNSCELKREQGRSSKKNIILSNRPELKQLAHLLCCMHLHHCRSVICDYSLLNQTTLQLSASHQELQVITEASTTLTF